MGVTAGVLSAITGTYAAVESYEQGQDLEAAADEQDAIAAENQALADLESAEEIRRLERKQQETLAAATAQAAAGGSGTGGSTGAFIDRMQSEFSGELDWLRQSGASASSIRSREAGLESSLTRSRARGTTVDALSGISSAARGGKQAYEAW